MPAPLGRWLSRWRLVPEAARRQVSGNRHPGLVCRDGDRRVFVKASVPGDPGVELEAEALAALHAALGGEVRVPRVLRHAPGALALEWLDGRTLYEHRRRRGLAPVDRDVGAALARIHHGARNALERLAIGDFGERLVWTSPELYASLGPAGLQLFHRVQRAPRVVERLVWLLETETRETAAFVHGDLRQPNVLVTRRGVAFVDWEQSGLGDPARDLGMLLADDFASYVAPRADGERLSLAALRRHARGVFRGWRDELDRLGGVAPKAMETRVVAWLGEALLRRVYTLTHHEGTLEAHVLEVAVALLSSPARHAKTLLGGTR